MKESDATVGRRIRTLLEWVGVPAGTEGVIVDDYGTGIIVAWDLPDRPLPDLPPEDMTFEKLPALSPIAPLRDGFDKALELDALGVVTFRGVDFSRHNSTPPGTLSCLRCGAKFVQQFEGQVMCPGCTVIATPYMHWVTTPGTTGGSEPVRDEVWERFWREHVQDPE